MDEPRKNDRVSPVPGDRRSQETGPRRPPEQEANLTLGLDAAIESGTVDMGPVVQFLAGRVREAEREIVRLGRRTDAMRRRVGELESELSRMAARSSEHAESIRLMCAVLRDLDDPFGFGRALDDRLAYDEADGRADEDA